MITAEELEKLNELKEKGIITEEEFNLKREEFLNDTTDVSETSSSGFSLWGIIVVLSGFLTFCSIISGGNSDKGSGICGKYNTFYGGAFSGGWITTFDGFTIYIEFPNEYINKEWSKYDKQNICISGNTVRTPQQGNQPDVYTIYNPRFNGYAN